MSKKPIAILLTDTHLSATNIRTSNSIYMQAFKICKQIGIKTIFHLGDVFDSRAGIKLEVGTTFKSIITKAKGFDLDLHAIAGNHDKSDLDSRTSYLDLFDNQMTVYPDGGGLSLTESLTVYLLPYFKEDGSYLPRLEEMKQGLDPSKTNILLTHIGVDTMESNSGLKIDSMAKSDCFEPFTRVLIGHYHNSQHIEPNIDYIGSTFQHSHPETPDKGLTLLYDDGSTELIPLSFPKYETVRVRCNEIRVEKLVKEYSERITRGDKIRLKVSGAKSEVLLSDHVLTDLKKAGFDVQKDFDPIIGKEGASLEVVSRYDKQSIIGEYEKFCEARGRDGEMGLHYLSQI